MKDSASSAGRWLDVAPARFPGWIAGFAGRHGGGAPGTALAVAVTSVAVTSGTVTFNAPDGAVAQCHPPFPPVAGLAAAARPAQAAEPDAAEPGAAEPGALDPAACADVIAAHALAPRTVGVLLVRLGGYAAGVFTGTPPRLAASKTGARLVHGRSAAGGWSQHRFARRRENQATQALEAAAGAAAAVFGGWDSSRPDDNSKKRPGAPMGGERGRGHGAGHGRGHEAGLDAVVLGGDKRAVAELRADPRLSGYFELATDRFLTVPDPKLAVLQDAPRRYLAVRIWLTEPAS